MADQGGTTSRIHVMQIYFLTKRQTIGAEKFYRRLNELGARPDTLFLKKVINGTPGAQYPFRAGDLIILYINSEEELQGMVARREAFSHCRIILILPDGKAETIHLGLQLKPRFIDYRDGDLKLLLTVIEKITSHNSRNSAWDNVLYGTDHNKGHQGGAQ